jgi:hypothetical protein
MRKWSIVGLTVAWLAWELFAAFDGSAATWPLTEVVVEYVPAEVTYAAIGALALWLPIHFAIRYRRKRRAQRAAGR